MRRGIAQDVKGCVSATTCFQADESLFHCISLFCFPGYPAATNPLYGTTFRLIYAAFSAY